MLAIAQAQLCGPVYLSLPREVLAESLPAGMALGPNAPQCTDPAPDYPKIVEAYGGHGEHVHNPDELRPALERAVEICRTGSQALIPVHVSYPDAAIH